MYLFFVVDLYFVVVVELIEDLGRELKKLKKKNFIVLIVNSLSSIVLGCASLRGSLQGNQNAFRYLSGLRFYNYCSVGIINYFQIQTQLFHVLFGVHIRACVRAC